MPRKKATKITRQQSKFVDKILEGHKVGKAGALAGFSEKYGYDLMKKEVIQTALIKRMERVGITDDLLAAKMREGLDSVAPPRKDGGTQYPDFFTRKQYLDIILKIRGDYAPEKRENVEKKIVIVMNNHMIKALEDTGSIPEGVIDAEIIEEKSDAGK